MALFKNLKNIKDQITAGMNTTLSEEQLATLPPEQRAAYEQAMGLSPGGATAASAAPTGIGVSADGAPTGAAASIGGGASNGGGAPAPSASPTGLVSPEYDQVVEAQMASRVLLGPAGTFLYGGDPRELGEELHQTLQQEGFMGYMKASWKATGAAGRAEKAKGEMPAPQPAFSDSTQQVQHEWAQREQARAPYLAPARFPVLFTRVATRAGESVEAMRHHLGETGLAGCPELVFGLYPVPDHIGGGLTRKKKRYVEWDVVHAASEPLPPASQPASSWLDGSEHWVARASGEPSILDEDLAIAVLTAANVGPERCTGISRDFTTSTGGGGEDNGSFAYAEVAGVHVFHPDDGAVQGALQQLRSSRPIVMAAGPPPGVHIEVLNWREIAKAVQGRTGIAYLIPSPFPYLPSTPQELLKAYIDIVGVNPFDSYTAAVSERGVRDIKDRDTSGRFFTMEKTTGATQPCVDGKQRPRLTAGSVVVIAYRDRPDYVTGRERWKAYERDVLQARLDLGTGTREPVPAMEYGSFGSGTRKVLNGAEAVADFFADANATGIRNQAPHRYCWPPTDAR